MIVSRIFEIECPKYNKNIELGVDIFNISTQNNPNTGVITLLRNCSYKCGNFCDDCPHKDLLNKEISI